MGEPIQSSRTSSVPLFDLNNISMDLQKLRSEFGRALRLYQDCMQKLKLDPENSVYQQNVAESQKQIVAIDLKQKLFVKRFRSQMTPNSCPGESASMTTPLEKEAGGRELKIDEEEEEDGNSNGSVVMVNGGSNCSSSHYTPPNSEDECPSDVGVSRSISSSGSVSICADSISCPSSVSNTPLSSRPSSPTSCTKSHQSQHHHQPTFPSDVMAQEDFLKGFGLITHARLKSQSESKRVERRRRTTANPKYNTNGFVDLSQISRRTRRIEETEPMMIGSSPKRMTLMASVKSKQTKPKCIVCEQPDCNLTCECCQAQLHVDCIRVSGSKAPAPTRLQQCPRCIVAMNESRFSTTPTTPTPTNSEDFPKFPKPLIPTTPIIPANLKKKPAGSGSEGSTAAVDQNSLSSTDVVKPPSSTKPKAAKKLVTGKSATGKPKTSIVAKKAVLKGSTLSDDVVRASSKTVEPRPNLASPFKSLTALTSKGAAAKQAEGTANGNTTTAMNGNHIIPKKKSKLNGVKAKTLSVTGNNNPSNNSTNAKVKPKASPLNNINSNGNISNHTKPKINRLPKVNGDQHLSVQKTILAMTAAAKSVMSGMKVLPRNNSPQQPQQQSGPNSHDKETLKTPLGTPSGTPPRNSVLSLPPSCPSSVSLTPMDPAEVLSNSAISVSSSQPSSGPAESSSESSSSSSSSPSLRTPPFISAAVVTAVSNSSSSGTETLNSSELLTEKQ